MTTYIKACFCRNSIMSSLDQGLRNVCKYGGLSINPRSFFKEKVLLLILPKFEEERVSPLPPTNSDGPVRWMGDGWNKCGLLIMLHHEQWLEILSEGNFLFSFTPLRRGNKV